MIATQRCVNRCLLDKSTGAARLTLNALLRPAARSTIKTGSNRPIQRLLHSKSKGDTSQSTLRKDLHSSAAVSLTASSEYAHLQESGPDNLAQITAAAQTSAGPVPPPTKSQLRTLFVSSAIPMVGFGFMDNFIMIQAGGYIDATIGVKFGLATMTAAAMGQIVSDVSGVLFGGALERTLVKMGLIQPSNLTNAQRQLPRARNIGMVGAVLGVMVGCGLGATSLLFVDLDSNERHKRAAELQNILTEMLKMDGGSDTMNSEFCTLYLADGHHTAADSGDTSTPRVVSIETAEAKSHAKRCARTGVLLIDNHVEEGSTRKENKTQSILCVPVLNKEGHVMAVVEFCNKKGYLGDRGVFTESDERLARMLAHHVGIFIDKIAE